MEIINSDDIVDVQFVYLDFFKDARGRFAETFRKEWFPQRTWDIVQVARSESVANVLRGLHYHFHQVDYWIVDSGKIRVVLCDLRPDSPTYKNGLSFIMGVEPQFGLFVPVGVAHGYVTLTDAKITYMFDNYYDGTDDTGIAWNDPSIVDLWKGVKDPQVSERDSKSPF